MAIKVKLGSNGNPPSRARHRLLRGVLIAALACLVVGAIVFGYMYFKYQKIVDDRLASGPIFANVEQIYAAPREVRVGQRLTASFIAQDLRRAGYNTNPQLGTFTINGNSITIKPGPQSYHSTDGATITTGASSNADPASDSSSGPEYIVTSITADNGAPLAAYQLEPQLITALSEDKGRTKRRLVTYQEIPPQMVQSVLRARRRELRSHDRVCCARHPGGSQGMRRLHAHPAAREELLPDARQDHLAQDCRADDYLPA
jgi:penicillin-binding protein 1B